MNNTYKIGELAKLAGVTVRALHHYEEIGLLSPAKREINGYRMYGNTDIQILQRLSVLKSLGFSLEDIKKLINNPNYSLARLLPMQMEKLRIGIQRQEILLGKLKAMDYYSKNPKAGAIEEFFKIMNQLKNVSADFSEEEWEVVKAQGKKLGDDHIRAVEAEWPELIKKVQALITAGVDPKDERVTPLAKRWMELVKEFTGGHKGVEQKVANNYKQNASQIVMGDPKGPNMAECMSYIQKALK